MSYFSKFPYIQYQFPDDVVRTIKNITIKPGLVDEFFTAPDNFETYTIQDNDTPESVAYDFFGESKEHWILMLVNNIQNVYTDWPMTQRQISDFLYLKYKTQVDSDGVTVTLTEDQTDEVLDFAGSPSNNYTGEVETSSGSKVVLKPKHFVDDNGIVYSFDTVTTSTLKDAFGNLITLSTMYPVSYRVYEEALNDAKREIIIPKAEMLELMKSELQKILNE